MATERIVDREVAELSTQPVPGNALPAFHSEVLSRASFGANAAILAVETNASPQPPDLATNLLAELLVQPWPPIDAPTFLVEVLRRDTASSAIVATGMNAFGDQPWPTAQRGVFAFRHDWSEALVERLEWQTSLVRLASGNESRQARRRVPRRLLTYRVGNGRQSDALLADWLADHLGQRALWPLPQYAVHVTDAAERGAWALDVTDTDWSAFGSSSVALRLNNDGLQGWGEEEKWVLICAADGWQVAQLTDIESEALWLAEPLARTVAAGTAVMPLVSGIAVDPAALTQWVPGVVGGSATASIMPAETPDVDVADDPWLDEIPVWPDGNWRDDPTANVEGVITRQDFSAADPWVRRDDPWPVTTYQRRYLAGSAEEIEIWRARLWRTQGRLEAFWLPDGLAPVLRVIADGDPDDGFIRVSGDDLSAFWHRPAACVITQPDGLQQLALTATCHFDRGGVLVLRSGLDEIVPLGSRVMRLARCRLDHDAIDLYWHSTTLVEITLTACQLPEPRGNDRQTYEGE
jgi:hypothetical protein